MPTEIVIQFETEEEAQAFCSWQMRTRAEGTALEDHLTGPLLPPALVALDKAELAVLADDYAEAGFPWKVVFSKAALGRALEAFYPGVDAETIELPDGLDAHDPAKDAAGVMQTVRADNCIRLPLRFRDAKGRPFVGALQVALATEGGDLMLRVEGQPLKFKVLDDPVS